jgi:hypothetical protein
MADVLQYTRLITSEHNDKPNFMAMVAATVQGSVDLQNLQTEFASLFDVYTAVGDQLDKLGEWIGASRNIPVPLVGVYFTWGAAGLGWGQGTWFSPFDNVGGLVQLPDDSYRILLLAVIASNQWDGTIPGAYTILNLLYTLEGLRVLIQDNHDMSISIILLAQQVSAVALALLKSGFIALRPAGVNIAGYFKATTPVFGWGEESDVIQGWGQGNWIQVNSI